MKIPKWISCSIEKTYVHASLHQFIFDRDQGQHQAYTFRFICQCLRKFLQAFFFYFQCRCNGILCACRINYKISEDAKDVDLVFNPFNFLRTSDKYAIVCYITFMLCWCCHFILSNRFDIFHALYLFVLHFATIHIYCEITLRDSIYGDLTMALLISLSSYRWPRLCLMLVYIIGIIINSLHHLIYKH